MICERDGAAAKRSVRNDRGLIFFAMPTVGRWRRFGQGIEFVFLPKAPDQWMSGCRIALQPRSPRPTSYRPLCKRCCLRPHASASAEIFGETVAYALSFCSGTRWIGFISYYYFYIFNYVIQSL